MHSFLTLQFAAWEFCWTQVSCLMVRCQPRKPTITLGRYISCNPSWIRVILLQWLVASRLDSCNKLYMELPLMLNCNWCTMLLSGKASFPSCNTSVAGAALASSDFPSLIQGATYKSLYGLASGYLNNCLVLHISEWSARIWIPPTIDARLVETGDGLLCGALHPHPGCEIFSQGGLLSHELTSFGGLFKTELLILLVDFDLFFLIQFGIF